MNTNVEEALRQTLRQQGEAIQAETDPWTRFVGQERIHRRNRRIALTSAASVVVLAAAVVSISGIPFVGGDSKPDISVSSESESGVFAGPVRGSLAGDASWLAELRESIEGVRSFEPMVPEPIELNPDGSAKPPKFDPEQFNEQGPKTITIPVVRDKTKVLYAGDVSADLRLALLSVTGRFSSAPNDVTGLVWFKGPAGAAPHEMKQDKPEQVSVDQPAEAVTWPSFFIPPGTKHMLVIGPPGADIEIAGGPRYLAEGRVDQKWSKIASADGTAVIKLQEPGPDGSKPQGLRVTYDIRELTRLVLDTAGYVDAADRDAFAIALNEATEQTRGGPVDKELLRMFAEMALSDAKLDFRQVEIRVPWYGEVAGKKGAIVTLQPPGGGVLTYFLRGHIEPEPAEIGEQTGGAELDRRLLLPAEGATSRPLAWRAWQQSPLGAEASDTSEVTVIAPVGAATAEVVVDGKRLPVKLDATGSGTVTLPDDADAVVRAYDADGKLMGETPFGARDAQNAGSQSGLVGEDANERVVP